MSITTLETIRLKQEIILKTLLIGVSIIFSTLSFADFESKCEHRIAMKSQVAKQECGTYKLSKSDCEHKVLVQKQIAQQECGVAIRNCEQKITMESQVAEQECSYFNLSEEKCNHRVAMKEQLAQQECKI